MNRYTYLLVSYSLLFASAASAKEITVGADATVYGVAHEHGIRTQALINANNLKPPYELKKGQVLKIPAPNEHVVRKGEDIQSIAEDYGVNPGALAEANDAPQSVKEGDALVIPSPDTVSMAEGLKPSAENISKSSLEPLPMVKSEPAPTRPNPAPAAAIAAAPAGLPDDLAKELAEEKAGKPKATPTKIVDNSIKSDTSTSKPNVEGTLGQAKVVKPKAPAKVASSEEKKEKATSKPKTVKIDAEEKKEKKVAKKETKKEEVTEEAPKQVQLAWPVQGEIISKFKPGKNDGINIEVPEGTSVKAAATGEVKYAGSDLTAQGQLVLIKHDDDGLMSVYAHNSKLLVKKGDKVKQGQVIAKSGKTGDVKSPQLHFEVRKGKTPIDPLPKLGS